jgi:hypothetical protein
MFKKYQHVERFGRPEVEGIDKGYCLVFPKLDGTNASIWWDDGIKAGSRNRELSINNDNRGFYKHATTDERYVNFFKHYPSLRLYGEWLVPHSLKTYKSDAWNKFYVFDVMENDHHLSYGYYINMLIRFGIDFVPIIDIIENGTENEFKEMMEFNIFLMKEGEIGEGIVIKNYEFVNKFGRTTWAKMVKSEFKQRKKQKVIKEGLESDIADKYVTKTLVDKERAKIYTSPIQPRLLSTIYYCILVEELAYIVKKYKNPTINFKTLQQCVNAKVKEHAKDLF